MKPFYWKMAMIVITLAICMNASGYDFEVNGIFYGYNAEDQTAYVTNGTEKYSGNVVIPETVTYNGRTMSVIGIGSDAFNNCFDLLSVQIPKSITYIGDRAFFDCVNIVSVILSENIISIGKYAFQRCEKLSSIKLPEQLKTIASAAFVSCIGLETLSIPSSVERIEGSAFAGCSGLKSIIFKDGSKQLRLGSNNAYGVFNNDCPLYLYIGRQLKYVESRNYAFGNSLKVLSIGNHLHNETDFALFEESLLWGLYLNRTSSITTIYSMLEEPMNIRQDVFQNEVYLNAKLYIPTGTKDKYLAAEGWKNFFNIQEMDVADMWDGKGEPPSDDETKKKCEKPTIRYSNGKLLFESATEGAVCQSTITDSDITSYSGNEVQLGVTYNISVYATATGYEDSDVATATLCWIDVDPKTEGIENSISQVSARAILLQTNNGTLNISGAEDGINIDIYTLSGMMVGSVKSSGKSTSIATGLRNGEIAIVKIGEKVVKVLMK